MFCGSFKTVVSTTTMERTMNPEDETMCASNATQDMARQAVCRKT